MRLRTVAVALVVTAPTLAAQTDHPVSFGVLAGALVPGGGMTGRAYDPGIQLGALAEVRTPVRWLAARADAGYARLATGGMTLTDERGVSIGHLDVGMSLASAGASLVARVPNMQSAVRPYATVGGGRYWLQAHVKPNPSLPQYARDGGPVSMWGTTLGLGSEAAVGRATLFAEARYLRAGGLRLFPVGVGVRVR